MDLRCQHGVPGDMRYAILINEFSASASELFTGCCATLTWQRSLASSPLAKAPER
jgi:hypothetical protein